MDEKFKKIIYSIIIVLCLCYSIFSTVNWVRNGVQLRRTEQTLEQCGRELRELRTAVADADNKQYVIRQSIDRCEELCRNTEAVLSTTTTTVSGLRTTLSKVRANEEAMANELLYLRRCIDPDDSSSGNNTN